MSHEQTQYLATHALVLLDQGEIPHCHRADPGEDQKEDDDARQLAPDSEIDFHFLGIKERALTTQALIRLLSACVLDC